MQILKKIVIIIILLVIGSIYSQESSISKTKDLVVQKIVYNNELGAFINYQVIDTLTYRLLHRQELLGENNILKNLNYNNNKTISNLNIKTNIWENNSHKWESLYNLELKSNSIKDSIIDTKNFQIYNTKKVNNNNKIIYFLTGFVIGTSILIFK